MKKTIITALVVLLVMLAFVTCEGFITEPGAEKAGYTYTADGQKFVTVKVNTGGTAGSRSLNSTIAQAAANWVEVIFKDSDTTKYYKTEGYYGYALTLTVPVRKYTPDDAVMLIGTKSGEKPNDKYTLLAIGKIDADVTLPEDFEIEFPVTVLEADLSTGNDSTFVIETWDLGIFKSYNGGDPADPPNFDETKNGKFIHNGNSCFQVPIQDNLAVSLTITGLNSTHIFVKDGTNQSDFVTFKNFLSGVAAVSTEIANKSASVTPGTSDWKVNINFDAKKLGYYTIYFKIPVTGLVNVIVPNSDTTNNDSSSGYPNSLTWYIHGGTISNPDFGDEGEAVALKVADSLTESMGVTVPSSPITTP